MAPVLFFPLLFSPSFPLSLKKRGKSFQIQYYAHGRQGRITLGDIPLQIAKDQLRRFQSAQLRGIHDPMPTRTPNTEVVSAYPLR